VERVVERSQQRRGEELRLSCSPTFLNICTETFRYNTKAVFPTYKVYVFLYVVNVYSMNDFCVYLCMFLYACIFPLQELDILLYLCGFMSSFGPSSLCKECTLEWLKTMRSRHKECT
jgi:hypothetical protein